MTQFHKDSFTYDSRYLSYEGKFVARFKHMPCNKPGFVSFLVKHFTVEEYFAQRDAEVAPLTILEAKGYIPSHIMKWLKDGRLKEWKGKAAAEYLK